LDFNPVFFGTQLFAQENNEHITATIIGSGSPKFNIECSGPSVLIAYKNTQILVDMGNGTSQFKQKLKTLMKMLQLLQYVKIILAQFYTLKI